MKGLHLSARIALKIQARIISWIYQLKPLGCSASLGVALKLVPDWMGWAFKLIHLQFLDSPDPPVLFSRSCLGRLSKHLRTNGNLPAKLASLILILQDATWQKCTSINWTKVAQFNSVRGWGKDGWMVVEPSPPLKLGMFRCLSHWVLFQFFVRGQSIQ